MCLCLVKKLGNKKVPVAGCMHGHLEYLGRDEAEVLMSVKPEANSIIKAKHKVNEVAGVK